MGKKVKLTTKEKSVIFLQGIGTFILLFFLELIATWSTISIYNEKLLKGDQLFNHVWTKYEVVFFGTIMIFDLIVSIVRMRSTYFLIQGDHVIDSVDQLLASGKLNQEIDLKVNKRLQKIVNSINGLIKQINKLISDERKDEESKEELITNISHDIRTPLTSIIGYLGLIESQKNITKPEIRKYTGIAYNKSLQMQTMVNDLFEYTNADAFGTNMDVQEFDLAQLLQQVAAEFELEANKKNIKIDVATDPNSIKITADASKLGRVFNNLMVNAFKYGEGADKILIRASKIDNNRVQISVSNNGPKIPEESIEHLFERFYRVEESRSSETGGTGLGLSIAQNIIQMHGGSISASSSDEWTTFTIELPLK